MKRVTLLLLFAVLLLPGCGKDRSTAADQVNYMQLAVSASEKLSSEQFCMRCSILICKSRCLKMN